MSNRAGLILFLALACAVLVMNRGAYEGYFQADEIDNVSWAPETDAIDFVKGIATPLFSTGNFRPVGHFYFRAAGRAFGLDFPKYVLVLQFIHLLNVWLVWLLLRRVGAQAVAAAAATVFFALHMALFDALWKPMYVFDVLCGTFCLLSLVFFLRSRWVLSFLCFWLAYKSKEVAVMLPAVLACCEFWFGKRRWKPLVPFFLVSLSFGLQGMLLNTNRDNEYTFRFTPAALASTAVFYAGRIFLVPYLGFAALLAPFLARNRRVWFGLAAMVLFLAPLLFLPGRLYSAYCYVPFIGLAIAFAGVAEMEHKVALAGFFLLWLPADYWALRRSRRAKLALDAGFREYITTVGKLARTAPNVNAFVFAGMPEGFERWGVAGALRYSYRNNRLEVEDANGPESKQTIRRDRVALLTWDDVAHRLGVAVHSPETLQASYIRMDVSTPVWQLERGWFGLERTYRWIEPEAEASLLRPEGARQFELRVNVSQQLLNAVGPPTVRVAIDGAELEPRRFAEKAWQTVQWDLPPAPAGPARVTIRVGPPYKAPNDPRQLGIAIGAFGFPPRDGR